MHHGFDVAVLLNIMICLLSSSWTGSCSVPPDFFFNQLSALFVVPTTCYPAPSCTTRQTLVSDSGHKIVWPWTLASIWVVWFSKDFRD